MSSDTTSGPTSSTTTSGDVPLADVLAVLGTTLGIEERVGTFDATTPLFGTLPELDSLAVLELVTALEDRFGITVDEEDLGGGLLDTAGSLHDYVRDRVG